MKTCLPVILFFILAILSGCNKDKQNKTGDNNPVPDHYNISANIHTEIFSFTDQSDGTIWVEDLQDFHSDSCYISYKSFIKRDSSDTALGIIFRDYYKGPCGQEDIAFNSLISTGNHTFSDGYSAGVAVFFCDSFSVWSTEYGTQTNSSFNIATSESMENDPFYNQPRRKILGTFECTLYDAKGNSKNVTNGKFYLYIISHPDW